MLLPCIAAEPPLHRSGTTRSCPHKRRHNLNSLTEGLVRHRRLATRQLAVQTVKPQSQLKSQLKSQLLGSANAYDCHSPLSAVEERAAGKNPPRCRRTEYFFIRPSGRLQSAVAQHHGAVPAVVPSMANKTSVYCKKRTSLEAERRGASRLALRMKQMHSAVDEAATSDVFRLPLDSADQSPQRAAIKLRRLLNGAPYRLRSGLFVPETYKT